MPNMNKEQIDKFARDHEAAKISYIVNQLWEILHGHPRYRALSAIELVRDMTLRGQDALMNQQLLEANECNQNEST